MRRLFAAVALVAGFSPAVSADAERPPRSPVERSATSALIERADETIFDAPDGGSKRRGSAAKGARLPVYAQHTGPGCSTRWLNVGPLAWICGDHARVSRTPPDASGRTATPYPDGLPFRYFLVGSNGSLAYDSLATAEDVAPARELEPQFALAVVSTAEKAPGNAFGFTADGLWVPMRDLIPVRPLPFRGREVERDIPGIGWVVADEASAYRRPGVADTRRDTRASRFTEVTVVERARSGSQTFYRVGPERWLDARDVAVRRPATPPPEARPGERWIDVDRATQILTAYVGSQPVFSTLVSTGKGREGTPLATPPGTFRIWVKLLSTDMDNLEDEEAGRYYAIQRVPWVMFFKDGYGLHGTFWHHGFGRVRSHGCVNLAPLDAERLFAWTTPHLPVGWTAVLPTEYEPGTWVVVR